MRRFLVLLVLGAKGVWDHAGDSVLERNHHQNRDAQYTQQTFTEEAVAKMKLDSEFSGKISGNVYAQVLYVDNVALGKGPTNWVIAVTQNNQVSALDAKTGAVVWQRTLGPSARTSGAGCGNISPIGITGTPAIDIASRTLFVSAAIGGNTITTHQIHALSIDDGSERPNFPIDAKTATYRGVKFDPPALNQRGALTFVNGRVYVPYGGHFGDCGKFHGWVLGVPFPSPSTPTAFATSVAPNVHGAGIWAPGGVASDGQNVYVATGNSFASKTWVGQEAIIRLLPGPAWSNNAADYFAPHDWLHLDQHDIDIGGSGPLLVEAKNASPSKLVVALGKNGWVYLLDRSNLGGVAPNLESEGVSRAQVADGAIINAAASVTTSAGNTWLIAHGYQGASGHDCKKGSGNIIAMKISGTPPKASVEWCDDSMTEGSPMITTSNDSGADAIVWFVGTRLNGWDVETGKKVYTGTDDLANVRLFTTPIAANGRIYIGADDRVYAFHL